MKLEDQYRKEYRIRMKHVWVTALIQILLALAIIVLSIVDTWSGLYKDAKTTSTNAHSRIADIVSGYESGFKSILIPIKDKIAEDPSFEEMQEWLFGKEDEFCEAIGEDTYDGIALTYKGGYAHSWNYGDYSNYDPKSRPWYQQAEQAEGEIALVAPYVTFLSQENQDVENNVLMTIAQKYNDEIFFDLDIKLPEIGEILDKDNLFYPNEMVIIYNELGQILSSTSENYFAHNVTVEDAVITKDFVQMIEENAQKESKLLLKQVNGGYQCLYFSASDSGNTVCIMVPISEVFWRNFFLPCLVSFFLIGYVIYIFFRNRQNAIEFTERDKRLETIENSVQRERIYIDVDRMKFFGNDMAERNTDNVSYDSLYQLICDRLVDDSELERMEEFISAKAVRNSVQRQYIIDKERFFMKMQDKNGIVQNKTIEMRKMAFVQDKINMLEISLLDAAESVDLLKQSLEETKELRKEKEEEYNRFMSYICMAEDGVEELCIKDHTITRFYVENETLKKQTISYPGMPFELFHEDDRQKAHEHYDEDKLWELCQNQSVSYAELRMKWYDANEYRWCNVIVLGMPITEKTPFNVLVLIKDTDDIKSQEIRQKKALEDAFSLAQQGSIAKGSFLSKMSHEIRTPLNAIIGYLGIAKDSKEDIEKIHYCLDNSEIASKHLLQIINDVLDMSSIESGKMKIANEEFDLKKEISDITTLFYQNAKAKGQHFETHIGHVTEEWVIGDQLRVNQVLMNLLSNAVKFTSENGSVQLSVEQLRKDDQRVYMKFTVSDDGIGMSEEYMSRLFKPFEQEQASTARKYGGSGLGLSITNNLVKMMGGKISVQSEPNKGTTFEVTLHFELAKDRSEKVLSSDYSHVRVLVVDDREDDASYVQMMLKRCGAKADIVTSGALAIKRIKSRKAMDYPYDLCIIDWNMPEMDGCEVARKLRSELGETMPLIIATAYDVLELQEEAKRAGVDKVIAKPLFQSTLFDILVTNFGAYVPPEKEEHTQVDLTGMHVLLAEDNPMNMDIAVHILEKIGIQVDQAQNGVEASERFIQCKQGTYDLILMDIQMPIMDGYEATSTIRQSNHPEAKTIPIIAMTANAFAEDVAEALSKGMNAHIAKPIDYDKLVAVLKKYQIKHKTIYNKEENS